MYARQSSLSKCISYIHACKRGGLGQKKFFFYLLSWVSVFNFAQSRLLGKKEYPTRNFLDSVCNILGFDPTQLVNLQTRLGFEKVGTRFF